MLPSDPGFWEILNSSIPPGPEGQFIVRDPITGLNVQCFDIDDLRVVINTHEYEEWEEEMNEANGIIPYYTRPIWV